VRCSVLQGSFDRIKGSFDRIKGSFEALSQHIDCSVLQVVTSHRRMRVWFHRVAVCCSMLQRLSELYRVLQCVVVCCSVQSQRPVYLQCDAVCCSVLQHVAECFVLQCVVTCHFQLAFGRQVWLQYVALYYSMLQCMAVRHSVLQRVNFKSRR